MPRFEIIHTSEKLHGQIYIPRVNMLLGAVVIILVLGFEKSNNLAAAYGIAVTGNMLVTTVFLYIVMTRIWAWSTLRTLPLIGVFIAIDLLFFSANIIKIHDGGWASIGFAFLLIIIMWTWVRGSRMLSEKTRKAEVPLDIITSQMHKRPPVIVPGTAVFLTNDPRNAPTALMHSLKHYKVLHENNVILTIVTASSPWVISADRVRVSQYNERFMQVTLTYGYMQQPNIPRSLSLCRHLGWNFNLMSTSFFLSRRALKVATRSSMPRWQDRLFIILSRTASDATEYYRIPTGRVVEIGTQVNI